MDIQIRFIYTRSLQTGDHLLLCLRYPKGHPVTLEMYSISATCRATMEALSEYLKMSIDGLFSDSMKEQLMLFRHWSRTINGIFFFEAIN